MEERRIGFNNDGLIKLAYRIIMGYFAFIFGKTMWDSIPGFINYLDSLNGFDLSMLTEAHVYSIRLGGSIFLGFIMYHFLIHKVRTYILTYKTRKRRSLKPGEEERKMPKEEFVKY